MSALRYRALDWALGHRLLPDGVLRVGSRVGADLRERRELRGGLLAQEARLDALLHRMRTGPIAEGTAEANEQHYELPPEFFAGILGPRRKYSGCLFPTGTETLAQAEEAMLQSSCERAEIRDGMRILDLGCGWGSMSLWLAEHYPEAQVLGVSNSSSQREYILGRADELGLRNLEIVTQDMNVFDPGRRFDRIVSIEMFEHMRNWRELLRRIAGWLEPNGQLFVHVFSHRSVPYLFEGTWAAERFFTAGLMPSHELMLHFQEDLRVVSRWAVPGTHYARTLRAWLANLDAHAAELEAVLREDGRTEAQARTLLATWRLFLISTEEIWGGRGGERWLVSQYLLHP